MMLLSAIDVVTAISDELSSHSTRNVWHTNLNFDNFVLPIRQRVNMNFMSTHDNRRMNCGQPH
ncbi:hypothetical protein BLOT_014674 [Blomia tropicalis]|nr:hypothetical protein BLOT_014674 [Blomia tropicalis]